MMKRRPDYEEFMDKKASDAKDAEFMCQREMLAAIVVAMFGKNRQTEGTYSEIEKFFTKNWTGKPTIFKEMNEFIKDKFTSEVPGPKQVRIMSFAVSFKDRNLLRGFK